MGNVEGPAPLSSDVLPASGAWSVGDPEGDRQFLHVDTGRPFQLEGGGSLDRITVAYETRGELDANAANAVLVCHALTGDSHVAGPSGNGQPTAGWWDDIVGPGSAIDTDRFFVVCANVLGGCQGSTGPSSIDPHTDRPYGSAFPVITVRDMVRAQKLLTDHLGLGPWLAAIGGSMGGMQVLEWAVMFPGRVHGIVPIAATAAASAQQIAWSAVERRAIALDPRWRGGDYYDAAPGDGPAEGLALAREIAQITYRTHEVFDERFGRNELDPLDDGFERWQRFDVEAYLDYHGAKLTRRFDANSYLALSKAMDLHDLARKRGGIDAALERVRARTLSMSIDSDALYPPHQQHSLCDGLWRVGARCEHVDVHSPHGHDGFLLEPEQVGPPIAAFLDTLATEVGIDD